MSVRVPTAAEVAALLVAACARLGVPPTEVFVEGARGADTAWLFDTDPEALLDALEHGVLGSRASA